MDQRCSETPQFVTTELHIRSPSFRQRSLLPGTCSTVLRFILHHIVHLWQFTTIFVHRLCRRRDLHQTQRIWLLQVAYLACNSALTTIQDPRIMVHDQPPAKTVDLGNTPININHCLSVVTLVHSSHFQGSAVLSPFSIQHDTQQFVTKHQHRPTKSKLWSTMVRI